MRFPLVGREAFDERGRMIGLLESELARVQAENRDLVNGIIVNVRGAAPFAAEAKPPREIPIKRRGTVESKGRMLEAASAQRAREVAILKGDN